LISIVEAEKEKAVQRVKDGGVAEKQRGHANALYAVVGKILDKGVVGRYCIRLEMENDSGKGREKADMGNALERDHVYEPAFI
jgi:hypothetical protein